MPHFDTRMTLLFILSFAGNFIISSIVNCKQSSDFMLKKNSERRWYVDLKMVPHGIGLRNVSKTQLINAEMLHNLVCTVAIETIHDSKQLYYTSKMTL